MRPRFFGARYFAANFFAASGEEPAEGGFFGSRFFAANYFKVGFYRPTTITTGAVTGTLDVTENADSLTSQASITQPESGVGFGPTFRPPRLVPIVARLDVIEQGDTLVSFAQLGPDPIEMDNNLLLMAA